MQQPITLKEAIARGWAHVRQEHGCTTITLDPPLAVQEGELVVDANGAPGQEQAPLTEEAIRQMTQEEALKHLFGIWKGKDITPAQIRLEAWGD